MFTDHAHDGVEVVGECHSRHLLALVKTNQERSGQPILAFSTVLTFYLTASFFCCIEATKGLCPSRQARRFIARRLMFPHTASTPAQVDSTGVETGCHFYCLLHLC